jgi:hypothetical protein
VTPAIGDGAEARCSLQSPPTQSTRRRLARLVTEVLAPAPTSAVALIAISIESASSQAEALQWGGLSVLFGSLIPLAYIVRGVRRRQLTDHHVALRLQRPVPLLVGVASVAILLGLLVLFSAPHDLVALVVAAIVGLALSLVITLVWKISVHSGVVAGTMAVFVIVFGPMLLVLSPLLVLVGWARVELADHTPAQVLAGAAVGSVVSTLVFTLLR